MDGILDGGIDDILARLILQSQAQALGETPRDAGQAKDVGS